MGGSYIPRMFFKGHLVRNETRMWYRNSGDSLQVILILLSYILLRYRSGPVIVGLEQQGWDMIQPR